MANVMQDGSYVLANWTEELKVFEQELESAHRHKNLLRDEALLFGVSDAPLLKAAQLYREEAKG